MVGDFSGMADLFFESGIGRNISVPFNESTDGSQARNGERIEIPDAFADGSIVCIDEKRFGA